MERDEKWEAILGRNLADLHERVDNARFNLEDYWYPLIDEAIADGDFDRASDYARKIPDVVTMAFAMDRIREGEKAKG